MQFERLISTKRWIIIWALIYIVILASIFIDPQATWTSYVKILGIFLCVVYAILEKRGDKLLIVALFLTFLADLVLFLNNTSAFGVLIFCLVQLTHMVRLTKKKKKFFIIYPLFLLATFLAALCIKVDTMYAISFVYGVTLIGNTILSIKWRKETEEKAAKFAVVGFLLFVSCDLCVATSYLSLTNVLPFSFYALANYLAWVFYYPSQVFISNSEKTVIQ